MFNVTLKLKRPLVGLVLAAGLLVAAGPASASHSGPLIAPPHTEVSNLPMEEVAFSFHSAVVSRTAGPAAGNPDRATEELLGNYNF